MSNYETITVKKIKRAITLIIVLALGLCITTSALVYSMVSVNNNLFNTGTVKINLNDGKPVINELLVEPGMTFEKEFFIENQSSCEVYYRLYFQNLKGGLSDVLQVTVKDGEAVILSGTPNELKRENVVALDDMLELKEKKKLKIYFHFPENSGNLMQNQHLNFDLSADAVQVRNNPEKLFN